MIRISSEQERNETPHSFSMKKTILFRLWRLLLSCLACSSLLDVCRSKRKHGKRTEGKCMVGVSPRQLEGLADASASVKGCSRTHCTPCREPGSQ